LKINPLLRWRKKPSIGNREESTDGRFRIVGDDKHFTLIDNVRLELHHVNSIAKAKKLAEKFVENEPHIVCGNCRKANLRNALFCRFCRANLNYH